MQKAAGLRDIEERGTLAAIHALGILDVDADPVLESLWFAGHPTERWQRNARVAPRPRRPA